jgi:membrane-anchored protein YejM (alkaline phosphatase superfamily)
MFGGVSTLYTYVYVYVSALAHVKFYFVRHLHPILFLTFISIFTKLGTQAVILPTSI